MPSPQGRPRISVVISTFNSELFLRACLTQMLRQTALPECEIIVVDSGSQQNEAAVCAAMHAAFPRLIYQRTPRETIYAAWNRALAIAQGDYFVNANADDALHPDALRLLAKALDEHPEGVLAYGDWLWSEVPNATFPWDRAYRHVRHCAYHPAIPLFYCYTGCTQFWRTVKLRELGGFNAQRWAAGDYEALCNVVKQRWAVVYAPAALSAYYQNPFGLSRSSDRSIREFRSIRNYLRASASISTIFDVDETDAAACARGWLALARRAIELHVPWAAGPNPDLKYALYAVQKAVLADPSNQPAMMLRRVLVKHCSVWSRLFQQKKPSINEFPDIPMDEPPPRVRPIIAGTTA